MARQAMTKKLMVVGIDGMDARITKHLMDEGKMPNLQKFVNRGSCRDDLHLLGAIPTITPPCWTTLATGAYPGTHGITCYWRQSPESLDAVVYNMDSRHCEAEQMWNVTTEAGKKTLVWHWPGSSWPPSSESPLLHVVDGTQPGSVNMGVAQMDWEKIIVATPDIEKVDYAPRVEKPAGVGCIMTDIDDMVVGDNDDEMMELWWGDEARKGGEIRTPIMSLEDTEMMIGAKVAYDIVNSPLKPAEGWKNAPEGALEFTILTSSGFTRRPALLLKNEAGEYDSVAIYKNKKATEPIVVVPNGKIVTAIDDVTKKEETKPACRSYKILELDPKGTMVRMWISNALDTTNDMLWHTKDLYQDIVKNVGPVPPVSLIGGEEVDLVRDVFIPSWDHYCEWQADCLNYLAENGGYEVMFSHLHNVDCAGHQLWHLGKTLEPWKHTNEKDYQACIVDVYRQTDDYLGRFLHFLDEDWTVLIVSDHGLIVGEEVPPLIGEYGGLNVPIMEQLGYTVMKKDENGNDTRDIDWEKTKAVAVRTSYIWINLKGRDEFGIVEPEDKYAVEEQIIDDLYRYRDANGDRIIAMAFHNKDAKVLGLDGPYTGDIVYMNREHFVTEHGQGLSTYEGYYGTSVSPIFVAAGDGIKHDDDVKRTIRQVDVAPTVATLLGTRMPRDCEGAPVYQILED